MWDRIRRLIDRKESRRIATSRRFLVESLENRLNFSVSVSASMDIAVAAAIQERLDNTTPLEASRLNATVDASGGWRPQEIGSPSSVVDHRTSASIALIARREVEPILRANRTGGFEPGGYRPTLGASRSPVTAIYSQPVFIFVPPAPLPIFVEYVFVYSSTPRQSVGFHSLRSNSVTVADRPRAAALNLSQYDAPSLDWDADVAESQQIPTPSSLVTARHDLALASLQTDLTPAPAVPTATIGSVSRSGELASERGLNPFYGDDGGLIDIGRGKQFEPKPTGGDPMKPDRAATEAPLKEQKTRLTEPSEDATAARDEKPRIDPRIDSSLERALADNAEGGLIDLSEVSTAGEVLTDTPAMIAAADSTGTPVAESVEPIQVDRSIGLFRAFELAVAPEGLPEGVMIEETVTEATVTDATVTEAAAAGADDDSAIETPVSTDSGEADTTVIPGAVAIPAVLMVASWANTNRRRKRRGESQSEGV